MFLTHFRMTHHPFAEKPPMEWILKDSRFDEALARLNFFQKEGHIALILGQTGLGKSSLLRWFTRNLPQHRYQALYFSMTSVTPTAFLRQIVVKLGESPKIGKDRLFLQILEKIKKCESETILVLDEAHLITSQTLVDLRLLAGSGLDTQLPLKMIFCGQEGLGTVLKQSLHTDLVQRIAVRCRLPPLSRDQTAAYIDHRMKLSGSSEKTFDPEAKASIHDYSGGIPRQINNIATACLIHASSRNLTSIGEMLVNETMAEFQL